MLLLYVRILHAVSMAVRITHTTAARAYGHTRSQARHADECMHAICINRDRRIDACHANYATVGFIYGSVSRHMARFTSRSPA